MIKLIVSKVNVCEFKTCYREICCHCLKQVPRYVPNPFSNIKNERGTVEKGHF